MVRVCITVLAGGRSRRMGRDKRALVHPSAHQPLIQYVCRQALATGLPVYCLSDKAGLDTTGCRVLVDLRPYEGPYRSLLSFCASHVRDYSHCVVLATDMPGITAQIVGQLLASAEGRPDVSAHFACLDGRRQYLCAVYRLDALVQRPELDSFRQLTEQPGLTFVDRHDLAPEGLININTPEEWEQWKTNQGPS